MVSEDLYIGGAVSQLLSASRVSPISSKYICRHCQLGCSTHDWANADNFRNLSD